MVDIKSTLENNIALRNVLELKSYNIRWLKDNTLFTTMFILPFPDPWGKKGNVIVIKSESRSEWICLIIVSRFGSAESWSIFPWSQTHYLYHSDQRNVSWLSVIQQKQRNHIYFWGLDSCFESSLWSSCWNTLQEFCLHFYHDLQCGWANTSYWKSEPVCRFCQSWQISQKTPVYDGQNFF